MSKLGKRLIASVQKTRRRLEQELIDRLICPVCRKDFSGYVLCATRPCERCRKFVPFLREEG